MITKESQELKKRYFGEREIKKVFYKGVQIWPTVTTLIVTPTSVSIGAEGGTVDISITTNEEWVVTNANEINN